MRRVLVAVGVVFLGVAWAWGSVAEPLLAAGDRPPRRPRVPVAPGASR